MASSSSTSGGQGGQTDCSDDPEWAIVIGPISPDVGPHPEALQSMILVDTTVIASGFTSAAIGTVPPNGFYLASFDVRGPGTPVVSATPALPAMARPTVSLAADAARSHVFVARSVDGTLLVDDYPLVTLQNGSALGVPMINCTGSIGIAQIASNDSVPVVAAELKGAATCFAPGDCSFSGTDTSVVWPIVDPLGCPQASQILDHDGGDDYRTSPQLAVGPAAGNQLPLYLTVNGGTTTLVQYKGITASVDIDSSLLSITETVTLGDYSLSPPPTRTIPTASASKAYVASTVAVGAGREISVCSWPHTCAPSIDTTDGTGITAAAASPDGLAYAGGVGNDGIQIGASSLACADGPNASCPFWAFEDENGSRHGGMISPADGGSHAAATVIARYCDSIIWGGTFEGGRGKPMRVAGHDIQQPAAGRFLFFARQKIPQ